MAPGGCVDGRARGSGVARMLASALRTRGDEEQAKALTEKIAAIEGLLLGE